MSTVIVILLAWLAAVILFSLVWVVQKRTGDAGIVDVVWGLSIGCLAIAFCAVGPGNGTRRLIVAVLAALWAIRLSWYLLIRVINMPEDGRYVELKAAWGDAVDWKMFRFYQIQAAASVLFALPMLIAARNATAIGLIDYLGIAVWIIAIGGESVADRQLHRFRTKPENKGKVCRNGLWKYSRHPNYFFEWLHWWAYVLLAITGPWGWLSVIAPLAMLHFIVNVTGIPPTEKLAIKSRGDAYRDYQKTTSAFCPWFPKKIESAAANTKTQ